MLDVTHLVAKNFLCLRASIEFPNRSNRVGSTKLENLLAGDAFSDVFWGDLGRFRLIFGDFGAPPAL